MFSTCSELTPRAPSPAGRLERFMHPHNWCILETWILVHYSPEFWYILFWLKIFERWQKMQFCLPLYRWYQFQNTFDDIFAFDSTRLDKTISYKVICTVYTVHALLVKRIFSLLNFRRKNSFQPRLQLLQRDIINQLRDDLFGLDWWIS